MDGQRFDMIGKWLATRDSRRSTLRGFAAGTLAIGLGRISLDEAAAACKHIGQKCDKNGDCCAGAECKQKHCKCKRGHPLCGDGCCARGETCFAKTGNDAPPPVCCTDANICGFTCCPPDRVCVCLKPPPLPGPAPDPNDLCKCICRDGFEEDADGNCVCSQACGDDCCEEEDGEVCCPTSRGRQHCVLIASSEQNCGGCGKTCSEGEVCCNGTCVQLDSDPANCGACGNQCPRDRVCKSGKCVRVIGLSPGG